jgi:hypothetical protein
MTIDSKIRRLALVGAAVGAIAAPSAHAAAEKQVQIGGELVAPAKVSEWQALAGVPVGAHLVLVDGRLVRPEQVATVEARAGQTPPTDVSARDDGSGWSTTSFEIGLSAAFLFGAGLVGVVWRGRRRLGTA